MMSKIKILEYLYYQMFRLNSLEVGIITMIHQSVTWNY